MQYLVLQYFMAHDIKKLPQSTKIFIDNMLCEKERLILQPKVNYLSIQFFHLSIAYFALREQKEKAKELLQFLEDSVSYNNSFYKYLKLRSEYFAGISIQYNKVFSEKFFYGKEGFYKIESNIIKLVYALKED